MGNELSYEYSYYGGDGLDRHNWADVSQAALRREQQAEVAFATLKKDWESRCQDLPSGSKHVIPLLDPSHHLVQTVWVRFRRHVNANNKKAAETGGHQWDLKRRLANEEERKSFHITRKSKAYFVEAIFTVGGGSNNKNNNNKKAGGGSQQAAFVAAAASSAPAAAASVEIKKRASHHHHPPGLLLSSTSTNSSSTSGAPTAPDPLSKKPRRLQDVSNSAVVGGATASSSSSNKLNKKNPALPQKPAPPAPPQPVSSSSTQLGGCGGVHHSFKYGDIVGIVSSSSSPPHRNVVAASSTTASASAAAAAEYNCRFPTLAMVLYLVDPHTVRLSYPNREEVSVPIHQLQLVQPMTLPPMMMMTMPATSGGYNNVANTKGN